MTASMIPEDDKSAPRLLAQTRKKRCIGVAGARSPFSSLSSSSSSSSSRSFTSRTVLNPGAASTKMVLTHS